MEFKKFSAGPESYGCSDPEISLMIKRNSKLYHENITNVNFDDP